MKSASAHSTPARFARLRNPLLFASSPCPTRCTATRAFVGIDYHKRFDYRSLQARRRYHEGEFGATKDRGAGLTPVGYGYRSIEFLVQSAQRVERSANRTEAPRDIDAEGLTPANSRYNEQAGEAARESILNRGRLVELSSAQR